MNAHFKTLTEEALKLTPDERQALAQVLMASLRPDEYLDEAWEQEVAQRVADIESGLTQALPLSDALHQVRSRLK